MTRAIAVHVLCNIGALILMVIAPFALGNRTTAFATIGLTFTLVIASLIFNRSLYRLFFYTRSFEQFNCDCIRVHAHRYNMNPVEVKNMCDIAIAEYSALADAFGFSTKRHIDLFVFHDEHLFNKFMVGYKGWAFFHLSIVAVVKTTESEFSELLRHEFAHIFSATFGTNKPASFFEGLATYFQYTSISRAPLSELKAALDNYAKSNCITISLRHFYCDSTLKKSYYISGILTCYLIRKYGWQKYITFYRQVNIKNAESLFRNFFADEVYYVC